MTDETQGQAAQPAEAEAQPGAAAVVETQAEPAARKTDWRDRILLLGGVAQMVAAVAVVASLIFVGVQLQQTNAIARQAELNAELDQVSTNRQMWIENRDVTSLLMRGLAGTEPLDAVDSSRFEFWLEEIAYGSYLTWQRVEQGFFPRDRFLRVNATRLGTAFCTTRGSAWWSQNARLLFDQGFVETIDAAVAATPPEACADYLPPPLPDATAAADGG
jgi:hypothetical protein